ncbi:RICIN domain-containing protein [Streptomyces sp. NPDC059524]|uniref:RICIN domain-containing protein n=1 Tax=Streptomyces sp. NPDC059524 TaxID=3346856 RepID=UPI0036C2E83D
MPLPSRRRLRTLVAAAVAVSGLAALVPTATADSATYTVTVGAKGRWSHPDDTPAGTYIDKDGTFYFQSSHALYGATDPRKWNFYSGADLDTASLNKSLGKSADPSDPTDRNDDTTARCNNSPTGRESSFAPAGSSYAQKNYCDLAGVWVDPDTGDWYGLVHNEFTPQPFGDSSHFDGIDYAVSKDQGRTWTIKDHVITSPYSTVRGDTSAFPQQTYHYGDGDPRLFTDTASGYFYVFYGSRIVDKNGGWRVFHGHVARAPISAKMAPGSWQKWYDGSWSQPGDGGLESNMVPVDAAHPTGYTPAAQEYDPATPGTANQQVAAGAMPPTSPLFVMDITYNAHLGLYIGEPQGVDQSGNAPQQIYATDDLSTQKWRLLGDTGGYTTASWYRWFLDSANKTSTRIVGRDFRAYCSYGCSNDSYSEYVNLRIDTDRPAAPVDEGAGYRIAGANGRVLAQVSGGSAATSVPAGSGGDRASWTFTANGDGSYRITNDASRNLLGVDSRSTAGRAWGAAPSVTAAKQGVPSVGQQWFVLRNTTADGTSTGTYRLVNRYSGLVLGLSAATARAAETTPPRYWDASGGTGGTRTPGEQTLTLSR